MRAHCIGTEHTEQRSLNLSMECPCYRKGPFKITRALAGGRGAFLCGGCRGALSGGAEGNGNAEPREKEGVGRR